MTILIAIIYGIIQGIAEFIPVSSSGHLALMPMLMTIRDPGVVFDLSMHMGTLLAVVIYFNKEMKYLMVGTVGVIFKREKNPFVINMIISTAVTFLLVLVLKEFAESFGRSSILIAINLAFFGLLMFIADQFRPQDSSIKMKEEVRLKQAFLIGFAQALAIFPGVSRSGATLTIARFLQLTREEASRYSFLLSVPIIVAGFIYKFPEFFKDELAFEISHCIIGGFFSFLVGILSIHFFLQIIGKIGLKYFALYRVIIAAVLVYHSLK